MDINQTFPGSEEDRREELVAIPGLVVANTLQLLSQATRNLARSKDRRDDEDIQGLIDGRTEAIVDLIAAFNCVVVQGRIGTTSTMYPEPWVTTVLTLIAEDIAATIGCLDPTEYIQAKVEGKEQILRTFAKACDVSIDMACLVDLWDDFGPFPASEPAPEPETRTRKKAVRSEKNDE